MTIVDPATKLSPCPWCRERGRIITNYKDSVLIDIRAGCVNDRCKVQPKTKAVIVLGKGYDLALRMATSAWEDMY